MIRYVHPGSRIRIQIFSHSGSPGQKRTKSIGSLIRIRKHWCTRLSFCSFFLLFTLTASHTALCIRFRYNFKLNEFEHHRLFQKSHIQSLVVITIAACKTYVFSRIFSILHAVSDTFWLFAKRGQTTFKTKTKGNKVTFPNNVTQVILIIVILRRSLLVTLFLKSAKELCFWTGKVTCSNQSPGCKLPAESANCMQRR